jgi:hypothetical protein
MKRKIYAPVTEFERATSYCPLYLAWRILDEARNYFQTPIPEAFADKIAHRAEAVFARHPFWSRKAAPRDRQRQFQSQRQREFILTSMRHWLAGVLAKERPALFRDLPESFKVGHPLPQKQTGGAAAPPYHKPKTVGLTCRSAPILGTHSNASLPKTNRRTSNVSRPVSRFVHGCELLPA